MDKSKRITVVEIVMNKLLVISCAVIVTSLLGCTPKVGSDAWCEDMKAKDKGDWTANDAKDFAKHCVFK